MKDHRAFWEKAKARRPVFFQREIVFESRKPDMTSWTPEGTGVVVERSAARRFHGFRRRREARNGRRADDEVGVADDLAPAGEPPRLK